MEPVLTEGVDSPRLQLRGLPSDTRVTARGLNVDRFIDRRGSTSDALLDFRSPRFESLETVRRANLRIERRQSLLPASTDPLDLHTPRGEEPAMSYSGTRSDVRLDDGGVSAPLVRRSATTATSPLAMAIARRDTLRKSPRQHDGEALKGLDKEVQKFVEQEDEKRYKRALSVLEAGVDDSFAILPSTPERKKDKKEKGGKGADGASKKDKAVATAASFGLTRAMLVDMLWTAGAFTLALAVGLLLLRIEQAIRSLANRQSPIGKVLRALWALMFASTHAKFQVRR